MKLHSVLKWVCVALSAWAALAGHYDQATYALLAGVFFRLEE